MSYWDDTEGYNERGIDYDLYAAIEYNTQDYTIDDIERVLGVIQGQNDEESWHWILDLKNGTYVYATGYCDYTGWDCQSSMSSYPAETVLGALERVGEHGSWSPGYDFHKSQTYNDLYTQAIGTKKLTWHQQTAQDFTGITYGVDLNKIKQSQETRGELLKAISATPIATGNELRASWDGAMKSPPLASLIEQPYAPQYEAQNMTVFDAIMVTAFLLRADVWFCSRPITHGMVEVVVKYEDREHLLQITKLI